MDRNPSPLPDDLIDQDVLRADIIGSTVFSKQWVLASLINLLKGVEKESSEKEDDDDEEDADSNGIEMDKELEEELCKLWDMSANEEVVAFLHEWKSAEMLISVVAKTNSPRTTEICIGILANMACTEQMRKVFTENEQLRDLVIALLEGRDPQTLVEVTRLLHACVADKTTAKPWLTAIKQTSTSLDALTFILLSSTNSELVFNVSCLFDVLLDIDQDILVSLSNNNFIQAVVEASKEVRNKKEECHDMLLHCLQVLSSEQEGVRVLVECCSNVFPILYEYLETICEDDVVTIIGRERALASVVSILQVLLVNSDMGDDEQVSNLFKFLLSILATLKSTSILNSRRISSERKRRKSRITTENESSHAQDNETSKDQTQATTDTTSKSGGSDAESGVRNHLDNEEEDIDNEQTTMLLALLTDFFVEVNQGEKTSLLRQLKSCSPKLLKTLASHLQCSHPDLARLLHRDKT